MKTLSREGAVQMLNKVPEITLYFWIIKIMCTTVGETAADFLNVDLQFGLVATSVVTSVLLAVFLIMQLRSKRYVPWLYWLVVVLISTVGTLITDNLVDNFGVSLETTTIAFSLALAATFAAWYMSEKTLSIHSIFTRKRELFYWAAILFTFALGTAAGDLVAEGLNLGYATSAVMFGSMIGAVMIGYYGFKLNAITSFWVAYILTRPLGASIGDYLMQPNANGGIGLGAALTNAVFLVGIVGLVVYMTVTRQKAGE
ncbi:MAG: hypothetical protein PHH47_00310 [Gallionella sp.]|jgi:uncharacterized membrane-anchored protein|nr:hypothetical protein [Gallionella sp.]MDD4947819.1 hypothetical protein [Gallionella sp.]MDO9054306.1 hypothetical protein [Gallionella sp.]MDP1594006.1 hypothetical protein [Gallionella sp.]MDP1940346.1 hypothetical protein [Gallionella sp.]